LIIITKSYQIYLLMSNEIVTICVGQCGNQVGSQYWNYLMKEHGINPLTRRLTSEANALDASEVLSIDRKDINFYRDDLGNFVPRAILIDLEPRVINHVQSKYNHVFNPENIYIDSSGGGAGNNWATGHAKADKIGEDLHNILAREAEACDSLEAFQLIHSISGGTGSGVGSWLLEFISDNYPKVLSSTYSIIPNLSADQAADITVGPYNAILSLKRLAEETDMCTVIDNVALNRIATEKMSLDSSGVEDMNHIIAQAAAGFTNGVRFPGHSHCDLSSLITQLVPMPRQQFVFSSISPIAKHSPDVTTDGRVVRRTTPFDVMRKLQDPSHCLASINYDRIEHKFISCLKLIKGAITPGEVWDASVKINEAILAPFSTAARRGGHKSKLSFVPWVPNSVKIYHVNKSHYIDQQHKVQGIMVGNNTAMSKNIDQIISSFERLIHRQAFIEPYRKVLGSLDEFYEACAVVEAVSIDYKAANATDYMARVFGSGADKIDSLSDHYDVHNKDLQYDSGILN